MISRNRIITSLIILTTSSLLLSSCIRGKRDRGYEYAPNMYPSVPYNPDSPDAATKDGSSSQTPVAGTVPVSVGYVPFHYANSLAGYEAAGRELKSPFAEDAVTIGQGKQLYQSFCSACHGMTGQGNGPVAMDQSVVKPPSYSNGNSSRSGANHMKDLTDGKIYHSITYGVNNMGPYASQISQQERWKIVMYVHQLQQGKP